MKHRGEEEENVRYPKELKGEVLLRMMAPGSETVPALSREFKVTEAVLYAWRRSALEAGRAMPGDGRNAERWSGPAKFAVVLETAGLAEAEVGEYCRARGLFPEQVRSWRLPGHKPARRRRIGSAFENWKRIWGARIEPWRKRPRC